MFEERLLARTDKVYDKYKHKWMIAEETKSEDRLNSHFLTVSWVVN